MWEDEGENKTSYENILIDIGLKPLKIRIGWIENYVWRLMLKRFYSAKSYHISKNDGKQVFDQLNIDKCNIV